MTSPARRTQKPKCTTRSAGQRLGDFATLLREGTTANVDVAELLEKAATAFERASNDAERGVAAARALGLIPPSGAPNKAERDLELYYYVTDLRWKRLPPKAWRGRDLGVIAAAVPNACESDYRKAGLKFRITGKSAKNVYLALKKKLA